MFVNGVRGMLLHIPLRMKITLYLYSGGCVGDKDTQQERTAFSSTDVHNPIYKRTRVVAIV